MFPCIYSFLQKISSVSHSIVFLYFFALIAEEGFLISPCYSFEFCVQMGVSFFSPLLFASLLFTAIFKASSVRHFAFLHFFFLDLSSFSFWNFLFLKYEYYFPALDHINVYLIFCLFQYFHILVRINRKYGIKQYYQSSIYSQEIVISKFLLDF